MFSPIPNTWRSGFCKIDGSDLYNICSLLGAPNGKIFLNVKIIFWKTIFQIAIPLAQYAQTSTFYRVISKVSDVLMCIYLTLDPYVYVLQRYREKGRFIFPCCFKRGRSMTSIPTTTATGTPTSVLLHPPSFPVPHVM